MIIKIIFSIFLIVGIINPKISWKLKGGWMDKEGEPSKLYIVVNRGFSIVLLAALWLFY